MTKIQKILCALDFSPAAENALRYAFQLADVYEAKLHLLHVLEPITDAMLEIPHTVPAVNRKLFDETRTNLQKLAQDVLTDMSESLKNELEISTEVEMGPVGLTVNEIAREDADLIVVGTRGEDGKPWWISSVSKDIIDHPNVPVLVVPASASYAPFERITFATDLQQADVLHLLRLREFLYPADPEIRCLHIVAHEKEKTQMSFAEMVDVFSNQLEEVPVMFHQSEEDDTTEALEGFNLMYHIDLQVLVRPRRNFFQDLFHRSQSKQTAGYTHVPLLVWPG
ncbi:MAG: universal stress protein [Bacteroidota bacterium]